MNRLKIAAFLTVSLIFFPLIPANSADFNDTYGNLADYLSSIYGIDNNAGLTTFPILNIPMGGRSEGMSGAFAAVSDDASFIEFNPAGSSMLSDSELAFFHNNWIADSKIESISFTKRFGDFGIATGGKWLYLPFTEYNIYGERVSGGYYSEGVAILNASYNFLSSYHFSGLSFGISLKGAFRIMPDYSDDNGNIINGSGMSQSAVMAMADIGLLTRFDFLKGFAAREKNTSAALVIRNLGPPVLGEPLPTAASIAISYKPFRPLTIAVDFTVPVNFADIYLSEKPYGSIGISANITKFLSMRAGFMLKAGSSRVNIGSALNLNNIAIDINYTSDMLTQLQPLNRVSIGVRLNLGDSGRKHLADRVDELYLMGLEAYSRGDFINARLCWEEVLRLNPKYEPAKNNLIMLQGREDLSDRIDELYRLDL